MWLDFWFWFAISGKAKLPSLYSGLICGFYFQNVQSSFEVFRSTTASDAVLKPECDVVMMGPFQWPAEAGWVKSQLCPEPVMANWPLSCQRVCLKENCVSSTLFLSVSEEMDMTDWRPRVQTSHSVCSLFYIRMRVWNSKSMFTGFLIVHETTYTQESTIIVRANKI